MKFPLPDFQTLRRRLALPLSSVLNVSWWVILSILLILLFVDGLAFYQYGLGRVAPPQAPTLKGRVLVEEDSIRSAASILEERWRVFQASPSIPADLPNPFR